MSEWLRLLFFLGCLTVLITANAQDRQGGGPGRNYGPGGPPKICSVSGSVVEDSTAAPVPFASVAALRMPDSSLVGGTLTDEKGRFRLSELPPGGYVIRVTSVGFRDKYQPVGRVNPDKPELVGILIRMRSATARLKEVTVSADRPEFVNSIDKKVYNVDKSLVSTGGTVTDVLQNIPSVSVDIDGKVALRGSENVTILVDGKPSGMLGNDRRAVLQQIPASSVDQIEVITNPSAKYDAEGMAGIINIKTKKDKFQGTNGSVAAGIGTNEKYNMSLSGNDRTTRRNVYANGGFRHERRFNYGNGRQVNYLPGQEEYVWVNNNDGVNTSENLNGKAGVDFYLSSNNTLAVSGGFSSRSDSRPETINYLFYDSLGAPYDSLPRPPFFKNNTSREKNANFDANIDYKHIFTTNKGEFTSSLGYSQNEKSESGFFGNSLLDVDGIPYQASSNNSKFQTVVAQADLSWPFKKAGKLESGLKSTLRQLQNDQKLSDYSSSGAYVINPNLSNFFNYDEQVLAGYSMYSGRFKSFEYNAGLRLEQTLVDVKSDQTDSLYQRDYLNLFPSVFLKYTFRDKQELQVSYSRRINRPDSRQLNPFTDYSDSLNIRRGNPYLNPELINSMEFSYAKNWEDGSLTASLYYRYTDDLISRFRSVDTATGVNVMTTVNFSSSENLGLESIFRSQFGKWGTVMLSFNLFRNVVNADNISAELQSEATQWTSRLNYNVKVASSTSLQVTANYVSMMRSPVSEVRGMSGVDGAIRQEFWQGKGTLTLNVSDIFFTRKFRIHNFSEYHDYNGERIRESRIAMLNFSYRFGKMDATQRRRGRSDQRPGGEQMDMIDF